MIAYDPTENRTNSRAQLPDSAVEAPGFEALTGADILVSPLADVPATAPALIRLHAEAGALFVQRKSYLDLIGSVGERLNDALERMTRVSPRVCQRVLLTTGTLGYSAAGNATLDGRETRIPYWNVQMALDKWTDRGGVVKALPSDNLVPYWLTHKEAHLREYARRPLHLVFPSGEFPPDPPAEDDPLQLVRAVRDGRLTLASIPGIGPSHANAIWQWADGNLAQALRLLTDPTALKSSSRPKGIGEKTIATAREWLGVPEHNVVAAVPYDYDDLKAL